MDPTGRDEEGADERNEADVVARFVQQPRGIVQSKNVIPDHDRAEAEGDEMVVRLPMMFQDQRQERDAEEHQDKRDQGERMRRAGEGGEETGKRETQHPAGFRSKRKSANKTEFAGVRFAPGLTMKENPADEKKNRQHHREGELADVAEETRRVQLRVLGDRFDHQVGAVSDVGERAEAGRA